MAEGLPLHIGELEIYRALVIRHRMETERARRDALTMVNTALLARGADIDYWDIVGHLYPSDFVESAKRRMAERDAIADQMRSMESIMMIKTGGKDA